MGIHSQNFLEQGAFVYSIMRYGRKVLPGEGSAEEHAEYMVTLDFPGLEEPVPGT